MQLPSGLSIFSFFGLLFILSALSGCASKGHFGNFINDEHSAAQIKLAKDSAKQLEALYPPAKNYLVLQQDTPDAFGQTLVSALREAGFAVQAFDKKGKRFVPIPHSAASVLPLNPDETVQWDFAYILDQAGEPYGYHLTFLFNHQSLTRLYRLDDNRFMPAGDWVWKKD